MISEKTSIITQNSETNAVFTAMRADEEIRGSSTLLKILAMSKKSLEAKRFKLLEEFFKNIRKRIPKKPI